MLAPKRSDLLVRGCVPSHSVHRAMWSKHALHTARLHMTGCAISLAWFCKFASYYGAAPVRGVVSTAHACPELAGDVRLHRMHRNRGYGTRRTPGWEPLLMLA